MEPTIKVDIKDINNALEALARRMEDLSPVMADISDLMYQSVTDNFLQGGRPKWKKLRPATIEDRKKKGYVPIQILRQTGGLYSSIIPYSGKDYAGVGTNKVYATTMQFGAWWGEFGSKSVVQQVKEHLRKGKPVKAHIRNATVHSPWGTIPPRPFMKLPGKDVPRIMELLGGWLIDPTP